MEEEEEHDGSNTPQDDHTKMKSVDRQGIHEDHLPLEGSNPSPPGTARSTLSGYVGLNSCIKVFNVS